ncbi:MAG: rhomboid family intramembrane serine protease [Rhodobacteraceae bacterium CG17_big_fil_post_rev_8_21_14_2_50_63_15]|nr:rhomboid family intramembrane serine protease [Roseovarius sp.]PIV79946.1 MAG: rhomboid family intramembrane serine protease [Rhodobacteraceae bacterium CG17_big_fil_post_rev_8_21_14_2_50_63_15]
MFPIRDHNPSGRTPYVTYALIALNVAIFLGYWTLFADDRALQHFFDDYAMTPAKVTLTGDYAGLVTSMFLHGGLLHLGGNMLFLWIFGDNLEDRMGHLPYLAFYLACGIAAALAHVLAGPMSQVPTVGASGAIAGVMGGYLLLFPRARVDILLIFIIFFRIITIPAALMLALWFGIQIFAGLASDPDSGGVAYWAHAGGFVVGIVLTLPVFLRLGGARFWQVTHGLPPNPEADYSYRRTSIPNVKRRR